MNGHDQNTVDDEISLVELFQTLLRHWWKIGLFTVGLTLAAGAYFLSRPETYEARMLLDETRYDILYDVDHPAARQHLLLAKSTSLLARVSERMAQAALPGSESAAYDKVFRTTPQDKPEKTLFVSARMPSEERALNALTLWAEEYKKLASLYRAKRLLYDQERQLQNQSTSLALCQGIVNDLEEQWRMATRSNLYDSIRTAAVSNKIVELRGSLIGMNYNADVTRNLIAGLRPLCANGGAIAPEGSGTNCLEAASRYALCLVQNDIDQLIGDPEPMNQLPDKPEPVGRRTSAKAKIAVVFLLTLGLSSVAVLMADGMRRGRNPG
jgi:hypothetical protein